MKENHISPVEAVGQITLDPVAGEGQMSLAEMVEGDKNPSCL